MCDIDRVRIDARLVTFDDELDPAEKVALAQAEAAEAAWLADPHEGDGWLAGWPRLGVPVGFLGAVLAATTPPSLSGVEKVRALQAHMRMVAHHQAQAFEAMMAIVDEYEQLDGKGTPEAMEAATSELRAALTLTRRAAETDLDLAWRLRDRVPSVLASLRQGDIDLRRAMVIIDGTAHLNPQLAATVADTVLPRAPQLTTGQLRVLIRRLCIDVDPEDAQDRYESAVDGRAVVSEPTDAGTATIIATDLPAERAAAAMDRISGIAQGLKTANETRSLNQLRADVFLDLLEGTGRNRRRGVVDIRVDLATLMGLDDRTVELSGFGPVVADIGRQLSNRFGAEWRVTLGDAGGNIVHAGVTRRRPTASVRREVEVRDQTCVFPGCRVPATRCDLDHRTPVSEGGTTHADQLVALCRHDHVIRHRHRWTHIRNPDGSHTWTSPIGNRYIRPPP